jgi:signal transduction histidine kinase
MHDRIKQLKIVLVTTAIIIAIASLAVSHTLVSDLSRKERASMEVWAEAMRAFSDADEQTDLTLVLRVINGNDYIPVIVLSGQNEVVDFRNIKIKAPTYADSIAFIQNYANQLIEKGNVIEISGVSTTDAQDLIHLRVAYDESLMLQRLTHYPYIQLGVISLFVVIAIFALLASKRAEQDKVWVGLSRETAHQLGTPISSLMAWTEVLKETYPDDMLIAEMGNDVKRLQLIAERFSKIGSKPELKPENLCEIIERVVSYIGKRTSNKVRITYDFPENAVTANLSASLFEWVIENLCKNAIDAMQGEGHINIHLYRHADMLKLEVSDTGKGIPKNKFKTVFQPGYTTKKRGWGLGLSLAKRIISEYHNGRIYVKESSPQGTTFCIEIRS